MSGIAAVTGSAIRRDEERHAFEKRPPGLICFGRDAKLDLLAQAGDDLGLLEAGPLAEDSLDCSPHVLAAAAAVENPVDRLQGSAVRVSRRGRPPRRRESARGTSPAPD